MLLLLCVTDFIATYGHFAGRANQSLAISMSIDAGFKKVLCIDGVYYLVKTHPFK
jgi:hypothetical protein